MNMGVLTLLAPRQAHSGSVLVLRRWSRRWSAWWTATALSWRACARQLPLNKLRHADAVSAVDSTGMWGVACIKPRRTRTF